jgi:hypothetical protein
MRDAYRIRPEDFKRRVLVRGIQDRKELFVEEQWWLNMINISEIKPANNNPRYYNLSISVKDPWYQHPEKIKTIGEKISFKKKGKKMGPCSPEKAKAISEAKKKKFAERGGISEEHRAALRAIKKKPHTDEWKAENSIRMKEQWSNGTRKRAEPKQKMTLKEQAQLSADRLKSKWSDPEWAAKQRLALTEGAKKRPPRTEESKQKTRDTFAQRKLLRLQTV